MKKHLFFPALALCGGGAGFILRFLQNRTGFEPQTGLPVSDDPLAILLPAVLFLLAAACLFFARRLPHEKPDTAPAFREHFAPCAVSALPVLCGLALWLLSGALGVLAADSGITVDGLYFPEAPSAVNLDRIVHGLTAASAICLLPAAAAVIPRKNSSDQKNLPDATVGNLILLPVVFLVLRLALAYREMAVNASQQSYYVDLLAVMLLVLGFYRLSSFAFRCGSTRLFTIYSTMAVILCLTALADSASAADRLFLVGGAVLMLGFLMGRLSSPMAPPPADDI